MSSCETPVIHYCTFEEALKEDGFILYTCLGKSMLPFLREKKDIVEIHPLNGHAKKYDVILYKRDNRYVLHRVLEARLNGYVVCGDHNIRREYDITDNTILGVMTRVIRNGKSIYTTEWKYKVYVHLWCDFYPIRVAILYAKMKVRAAGCKVKRVLSGRNK